MAGLPLLLSPKLGTNRAPSQGYLSRKEASPSLVDGLTGVLVDRRMPLGLVGLGLELGEAQKVKAQSENGWH